MQAIIRAAQNDPHYPAEIALVISNNVSAKGLKIAQKLAVPTVTIEQKNYFNKKSYEQAMLETLESYKISIICLAGYMSVLGADFISHYKNRILNIHPSLLPQFPGLNAQKQALQAQIKSTGCTVHLVTPQIDAGDILAQSSIQILKDDSLETLTKRILEEEHRLYHKTLASFISTKLAEGVGFEPTVQSPARRFSRPVP